MDPYYPQGQTRQGGTSAPLVGPAPNTTQQLGCDNSEIRTMRAVVGSAHSTGSAYVIR